jgi:E3 ubiquitin-protein ligase HECTD1
LHEITQSERPQVREIVEVMTSVFDQEEDDEGHLTCLLTIKDLIAKDADGAFLEQFAKLGLFSKVQINTPILD